MLEELRELRVLLNLSGISRKEAAKRLFMGYSTLNRKLRGELNMSGEEISALRALAESRKGPAA